MPMRDQIGQLFMIGFSGTSVTPELAKQIKQYRPAGVILFSRNLVGLEQIVELTNELQQLSPSRPLLIAIDQEGGRVSRLPAGFTIFPPCAAFRHCESTDLAYQAALVTAQELRAVGINMNMAPVLDVDTNPRNPIIGDRAFGQDPARVSAWACAALAGLQHHHVAACGKHFPGHGDTSADSHKELPIVDAPRERLDQVELPPFRHAIAQGVASLMTAHVLYPALDPVRPATLSPAILTNLLRREMGFEGVLISDDLEMHAIIDHHGVEEAALLAFHAGVDLLLICKDPERQTAAYEALYRAAVDKAIAADRLAASLRRIAHMKQRFLVPHRPADVHSARQIVGRPSHQALLARIQSLGHPGTTMPVA